MCVFDAYGTLYDFNSAVARHRAADRAEGRRAVRDVAQQADPVHLAAQQHGRLCAVLAGDRRGARPLPRRARHRRSVGAREADGRLSRARSVSRSAGDARPAAPRRRALRHPVERQSRDARPDGAGLGPRRPLRGGAERRRGEACSRSIPRTYRAGRGALRREARQGLLPVVELLGRARRGAVRLQHRLGQPRRRAGRQPARQDSPRRSRTFPLLPSLLGVA